MNSDITLAALCHCQRLPTAEGPRERIFTKCGTNVPLVDIIEPDKLMSICSILLGVKVSIFPCETADVAVITIF